MTPTLIGLIGLIVLFLILFLGVPIGVGLGIVAFGGMWMLVGCNAALLKMAVTPLRLVSDYDMSVMPLFLLMAQVCSTSGIGRDIYTAASKWLGRMPGGVAMASIGACAIFAAISGSAVACAATIGMIAIPEMRRLNYDDALSTGSLAAGGTLGTTFPPSFTLILYGILTETSIGQMFMAGIFPGVLQAVFYMITIYVMCKLKPELGPRGAATTFKEKIASLKSCGEIVALVILVMAGIALGWFTPTEAGSVGAAGAILFTTLRRKLTWETFKLACFNTMKTTGMVFLILVGAFLFNYFVTLTNLPMTLASVILGLHVPPMAVIWIIIAIYMLLGTAMEEASMVMLTIPIFAPLVASLGFDKVWFGIIVVRMMQIGMISPPVGITLFVIKGIAKDTPMSKIYRGVLPFIVSDTFHVVLIVFVPIVVLYLPRLMR
jgi:C4-dicarboxylate transporter, DctM subunit